MTAHSLQTVAVITFCDEHGRALFEVFLPMHIK